MYRFPPYTMFVAAPLIELCFGRSGDKGDVVNIGGAAAFLNAFVCVYCSLPATTSTPVAGLIAGLIARRPEFYDFMKATLTEEAVAAYMGHIIHGRVRLLCRFSDVFRGCV